MKQMMKEQISLIEVIKPYSTKDLAAYYQVCDKTFKKWLIPFSQEIGTKNGRYYSVVQVKIIFDRLGMPCKVGS